MTNEEFKTGWTHFCKCVNFKDSAMDADAIRFMNEMPCKIIRGLTLLDEVEAQKERSSKK